MKPKKPQFPEVNSTGEVNLRNEEEMKKASDDALFRTAMKDTSSDRFDRYVDKSEENRREFTTRLYADMRVKSIPEGTEVSGDALARLTRGQAPKYHKDING